MRQRILLYNMGLPLNFKYMRKETQMKIPGAALAAITLLSMTMVVLAGDGATTSSAPALGTGCVNDSYPALVSGALAYAKLVPLPAGTILKAGDLVITEQEVGDQAGKAPVDVQAQLRKNQLFLLERIATGKLLLVEARADAVKKGKDASSISEKDLIQSYLAGMADAVTVSDEEIADFYKSNKDAVGGAELDKVKPQIAEYLRQQKQQELIAQHIKTIGQRTNIGVAADWAKAQAALAKDNPVDKARASGKPSLVDFGSKGCRPCDMLAPILETLKKKYDGQANVLFVSVVQDQILTARYGVDSIPVQVFFDKDGKEVLRHEGFYPQEDIEKKLAELGVK